MNNLSRTPFALNSGDTALIFSGTGKVVLTGFSTSWMRFSLDNTFADLFVDLPSGVVFEFSAPVEIYVKNIEVGGPTRNGVVFHWY